MQWCIETSEPSSRNLTTLERVKGAAGQETSPSGALVGGIALPGDDEINRLIAAASAEIEKEIHRPHMLVETNYREIFEGPGDFTVMLSVTPVASIDSVALRGVDLTDDDWNVNPINGIVFRKARWEYTGQIFRGIEDTRMPGPGEPAYTIDYTAGYTTPESDLSNFTLPRDIEQACIRSVLQWTQTQSRDLTIQRTRIGDVTQTFFAGSSNLGGALGLPSDVKDMLKPYVRRA